MTSPVEPPRSAQSRQTTGKVRGVCVRTQDTGSGNCQKSHISKRSISCSQSDGEGLLINKAEISGPTGEEICLTVSAHIFETENMPLI